MATVLELEPSSSRYICMVDYEFAGTSAKRRRQKLNDNGGCIVADVISENGKGISYTLSVYPLANDWTRPSYGQLRNRGGKLGEPLPQADTSNQCTRHAVHANYCTARDGPVNGVAHNYQKHRLRKSSFSLPDMYRPITHSNAPFFITPHRRQQMTSCEVPQGRMTMTCLVRFEIFSPTRGAGVSANRGCAINTSMRVFTMRVFETAAEGKIRRAKAFGYIGACARSGCAAFNSLQDGHGNQGVALCSTSGVISMRIGLVKDRGAVDWSAESVGWNIGNAVAPTCKTLVLLFLGVETIEIYTIVQLWAAGGRCLRDTQQLEHSDNTTKDYRETRFQKKARKNLRD
ncbi:hypothetical protein BJV78DRAFT_1154968 [Lactifluus subvellereus]|nr:hypothetical protein BJV78DRAFT_1154968 [Lactifluus subvellereus]